MKGIFHYNSNVFERRSDFNGASLRISIIDELSYLSMNSEGRFIGKGGELLNIFQRNFNLSLITKVSNAYGVKKTDGSWTGMIDDILKKRVDVCM